MSRTARSSLASAAPGLVAVAASAALALATLHARGDLPVPAPSTSVSARPTSSAAPTTSASAAPSASTSAVPSANALGSASAAPSSSVAPPDPSALASAEPVAPDASAAPSASADAGPPARVPIATRPLGDQEAPWFHAPTLDDSPRGFAGDAVGKVALTELILGGVLVVVGVPMWATSNSSEEVCGKIAGCFDAIHPDTALRNTGSSLTGIGLGFAAAGGMALGFSAAQKLTRLDARQSEGLTATGLVFSGFSLATLIGGVAIGAASEANGRRDPWNDASPHFTISVISFLVGIPMIAVGAPPKKGDPTRHRVSGVTSPTLGLGAGNATVTWGF